MPKRRRPDWLRFTRGVTRRHGEFFREGVRHEAWSNCDALSLAFAKTKIITWPYEDGSLAEARFIELEEEIVNRTFAEVEDAIVAAFVKVAREVIERERQKQGKP